MLKSYEALMIMVTLDGCQSYQIRKAQRELAGI